MKRLIAFIFLLVAIGGGAYYYFVARKPEEKPQILTATVSQGEIIESVQATGSLDPVRRVDVGSQVSGQVQDIYVDYNDIVTQGMLLAKIDPTLLETQVQIQESNVARQEGDIANQEVQLEDLQKQLERTQAMFEKGLQNQQQLEQAQLAVKTRQAQIDASRKQLVQTKINLDQARLNVSYTDIKSPIDGVVVERKVDRGQTVQASMTSPQFFVLATDLRTLKLTAGVDEAEIGRVRPGQEVIFTVEAYPNQEFSGTVNSVRLNATNQSNVITYPVWIDVKNPDLKLRPSMTASARIVISRAPNVTRVPNQALRFRPNSEMYTALGLTPPAPGQGRGGRGANAANQQGGQQGASRQGGQANAATGGGTGRGDESAQSATGRQGGSGRASGQGFGAQASGNLDPEAMARVREQFGGRQGGRGGRRGQQQPSNLTAPQTALREGKIDDLYAVLQKQIRPGQVWTWNEETKELKAINVRLGIDDGTFSELVSGEVTPGMQILTGIILPASRTSTTSPNNNNLFNPNQRGGPGGFGGGGRGGGGGGGGRGR
ncbi:MAG: efflux RND transporter periplasmic adaptor subunit [Vicinamibacterales bacterium]